MANDHDGSLGKVIVKWPAPGRLRPVLRLLFRAGILSVLAVPAAIIVGAVLGNPGPVLVLLWLLVLIKFVPQLLSRLALAERGVVVHENGMVIDDVVIPWSEVQSVRYYRHLHHLDKSKTAVHAWDFTVKGRENVLLRASDDYLGLHKDFATLDELLDRSVSDYRRFDDPNVVNEDAARKTAAAGRKRAIRSNADVDASITPELPWSEVIRRLKRGERRRRWRVAMLAPKMVATRVLPAMLRPAMHLSFLLGFLMAIEFCAQVVGMVSGSGLDPIFVGWLGVTAGLPNLLVILVLGAGFLIMGKFLFDSSDKLRGWATRYRATRDQLALPSSKQGIKALEEVAEEKSPFALYLRSFGGEYFRYRERRADISSPLETSALRREFDSRLISLMARRMKCFGLANLDDPSPPETLIQLFVLNKDWASVADQLMRSADRIILYVSDESPGLVREMAVLSRLKIQKRVLVVLPKPGGEDTRPRERNDLLNGFPNQIREDADDLEQAITAFMRS